MRTMLFLVALFFSTGLFAQEKLDKKPDNAEVFFSADVTTFDSDKQILELTGNASFSTSIVDIEQADKIVFNKKTKEFTISGFKEFRINGEVQLMEDLGSTTLKFELGTCVAYLVTE